MDIDQCFSCHFIMLFISLHMRLIFCLFILLSILSCLPHEHEHSLAVVRINGDEADFFSDSTGIYVVGIGTGTNWQGQKANYFEGRRIEVDFEFLEDGESKIKQKVGLKVSGGGSRKQAQKSFNIYADSVYGGDYLSHAFFQELPFSHYRSLRLRVSGQDWRKTHFRDALMHSIVSDLNIDKQAYRPVVLYLNDKYWGIYNLREKFNKTYLRQHHHLDKSIELDMLEQQNNINKGDNKEYLELLDFIRSNDLSDDEHFNEVAYKIDLDNILDYYCAQIYFANTDWPGNNIKYWKARTENAKWRWFLHDTDLGFARAPLYMHPGGIEHNTLAFNLNADETNLHNQPWATFLLRNLLKNEAFKNRFKTHFISLLDSTFEPKRVISIIDSLQNQLEPEIQNHIDRWKIEDPEFYQSREEWHGNIDLLREFAERRADLVKGFLQEL